MDKNKFEKLDKIYGRIKDTLKHSKKESTITTIENKMYDLFGVCFVIVNNERKLKR